MKHKPTVPSCTIVPRAQRGAVLVVGLIFLAILSLMGAAAYGVATQEERMSGNTRDRIRAFEAAEASLRDCEGRLASMSGLPAFDGTGGMYAAPAVTALPMADQLYNAGTWSSSSATRVLATTVAGVSMQPRCIVEEMLVLEGKPEDGAQSGPQQRVEERVYRITAMGYGANAGTTAMVQSTYRRQ